MTDGIQGWNECSHDIHPYCNLRAVPNSCCRLLCCPNRGDGLDSKAGSTTICRCVVAHTIEPSAIFKVVNSAIVDHPERHAYPMYVQYNDQEVPLYLTMKNCIVSHGQGAAEIEAGALGPGNLARDPMFQAYGSAEPQGYCLMQESPAVDAGDCEGAPADDLEGHPRPMRAGCDMGPFERGSGENQPPGKPSTPSGTALSYTEAIYSYVTAATDSDGDQVKYTFDWGDGTNTDTDFMKSGESASASHRWSSAGTYQVKAIAADQNGAASDWSSPLAVTAR
jgi:hypothetical protein